MSSSPASSVISQAENLIVPASMCGQSYHVPSGYYDRHYYYIFDGVGNAVAPVLTPGNNYAQVNIPLDTDADFILRRVSWTNAQNTSGDIPQFNFSWPNLDKNFFPYFSVLPPFCDFPVLPEIRYPAGGQLAFSINNYQPGTNASGEGAADVPYSELIFQGVKRYKGSLPDFGTVRRFKRVFQVYTLPVLIDYTFYSYDGGGAALGVNGTRRFSVPVNHGDFELWAIAIDSSQASTGFGNQAGCKFALVDPIDNTWFSNQVPITPGQFMDGMSQSLIVGDAAGNNPQNAIAGHWGAMIPPVLHPNQSNIRIDVQSLSPNPTTPYTVTFMFIGMSRVPC